MLIIRYIIYPRWKGGTSFEKKYLLRIIAEKFWIYVKKATFPGNGKGDTTKQQNNQTTKQPDNETTHNLSLYIFIY